MREGKKSEGRERERHRKTQRGKELWCVNLMLHPSVREEVKPCVAG